MEDLERAVFEISRAVQNLTAAATTSPPATPAEQPRTTTTTDHAEVQTDTVEDYPRSEKPPLCTGPFVVDNPAVNAFGFACEWFLAAELAARDALHNAWLASAFRLKCAILRSRPATPAPPIPRPTAEASTEPEPVAKTTEKSTDSDDIGWLPRGSSDLYMYNSARLEYGRACAVIRELRDDIEALTANNNGIESDETYNIEPLSADAFWPYGCVAERFPPEPPEPDGPAQSQVYEQTVGTDHPGDPPAFRPTEPHHRSTLGLSDHKPQQENKTKKKKGEKGKDQEHKDDGAHAIRPRATENGIASCESGARPEGGPRGAGSGSLRGT